MLTVDSYNVLYSKLTLFFTLSKLSDLTLFFASLIRLFIRDGDYICIGWWIFKFSCLPLSNRDEGLQLDQFSQILLLLQWPIQIEDMVLWEVFQ